MVSFWWARERMVGEEVEKVIINYFKKCCYKTKQKNETVAGGDAIYNILV